MNLKEQVIKILTDHPTARNSDIWLTCKLWATYYPSKIHRELGNGPQFVYLKDIIDLPREDNIKRIRAIIQNQEGTLLPTSLEVAMKRNINEQVWREYIKHNTPPYE